MVECSCLRIFIQIPDSVSQMLLPNLHFDNTLITLLKYVNDVMRLACATFVFDLIVYAVILSVQSLLFLQP